MWINYSKHSRIGMWFWFCGYISGFNLLSSNVWPLFQSLQVIPRCTCSPAMRGHFLSLQVILLLLVVARGLIVLCRSALGSDVGDLCVNTTGCLCMQVKFQLPCQRCHRGFVSVNLALITYSKFVLLDWSSWICSRFLVLIIIFQ